ncbi:MAG: hypothetical protein QN141_00900 [Armatimonadota bacterium]|nr:hypothetical protein [Armatimonadota bacterium]MDR7450894.1 hypothetical protein [Armatimonadota bacterium]MDR7465816.1 hypothetical protein [Armatimonadota bacterium]MDR7493724.1 hypothetical protein [Armatimonadota bacterium]MDR7498330.1 hypothetical protein [Armatimonadota bacterium]
MVNHIPDAPILDVLGDSRRRRLVALLVEETRVPADGRVRLCRLNTRPLIEVGRWAEQVRRFWETQLAAFADYVRAQEGSGPAVRRRNRASGRRIG